MKTFTTSTTICNNQKHTYILIITGIISLIIFANILYINYENSLTQPGIYFIFDIAIKYLSNTCFIKNHEQISDITASYSHLIKFRGRFVEIHHETQHFYLMKPVVDICINENNINCDELIAIDHACAWEEFKYIMNTDEYRREFAEIFINDAYSRMTFAGIANIIAIFGLYLYIRKRITRYRTFQDMPKKTMRMNLQLDTVDENITEICNKTISPSYLKNLVSPSQYLRRRFSSTSSNETVSNINDIV